MKLHREVAAGTAHHGEPALNCLPGLDCVPNLQLKCRMSHAIVKDKHRLARRIGFPSLQTLFVMSCPLLIFPL